MLSGYFVQWHPGIEVYLVSDEIIWQNHRQIHPLKGNYGGNGYVSKDEIFISKRETNDNIWLLESFIKFNSKHIWCNPVNSLIVCIVHILQERNRFTRILVHRSRNLIHVRGGMQRLCGKFTMCTGWFKNVLSMIQMKKIVTSSQGNISLNWPYFSMYSTIKPYMCRKSVYKVIALWYGVMQC